MLGIRRTAVTVTAFLLLTATWATAQSRGQHMLPAGTPIVFVSDANLDAGRREGDVVAVHLRDPLVLDGTVLAPAGARAYLVVGGTEAPNGKRVPAISLDRFSISAGLLPVKANAPIVPPLAAGTAIPATTLAEVDRFGDRLSIRVPFPFQLTGDQPASMYTPTPARTASPKIMLQRSPSPAPSPTPPPTVDSPAPDGTSPASPAPAPTKIPR